MQEKQSSPSHRALNVELWEQISVNLIWICCCPVYLRVIMWRENGGSWFIICSHPQGRWQAWNRGEKCTKFWWGVPKERVHSEDQDVERRMGSEWILGRLKGGVNWIRLAQDRDRWRASYISMDIYRYISIHCLDRLISTYIDRLISIHLDRLISLYLDRCLSIYLDRSISTSLSINIGISRSIHIDISLSINIDQHRYIPIGTYRYISIN
jgi:hypothetical protein